MTVFRWIAGVFAVLMAIGALGSFAVYIGFDLQHWLERARRFRRWLWLVALLWFNVEVWGRVIWTIVRWKS